VNHGKDNAGQSVRPKSQYRNLPKGYEGLGGRASTSGIVSTEVPPKTDPLGNDAVGFTKKDDRLPRFFLEERLPPSGNVFDVPEEEIDGVSLLSL
jgi:hypothetical protein